MAQLDRSTKTSRKVDASLNTALTGPTREEMEYSPSYSQVLNSMYWQEQKEYGRQRMSVDTGGA